MKKFEYKVLKMDITGGFFSMGGKVDENALSKYINKLGVEGWELVNSFDTNMAQGTSRDLVMIFKREK
jgi:hypothetical protein